MNACRIAILIPVTLMLLAGLVAGQVPNPAISPAEPSAAAVTPPIPAATPLPPELPANQVPGMPVTPGTGLPATIPGMPPNLPSLEAPLPGIPEGLGPPPVQPAVQPSENPLLKLFDANGDGSLSGDEVDAAPARLWELDRNLDAELSTAELGLVLAPRWAERRRAVRGSLPVEPQQVQPPLPAVPETPLSNERPSFQVYPLRGLDPTQTLAALQQLVQGQPDARLTFDGRTGSILVLAVPSTHAKIRDSLATLLEAERIGVPGLAPGAQPGAAPMAELPVVPRVVPLYNVRSPEILRIIQQVYRDRIVEPRPDQSAANPQVPGVPPAPGMGVPTVPAGKMVVGEGAEPNTIVVSAEDELFFEVVDLIERLDETREPAVNGIEIQPPR